MNYEVLFSIVNLIALFSWGLLIFLPKWRWTFACVVSGAIPVLLGIFYTVLIAFSFTSGVDNGGGFGSLLEIRNLFEHDVALLAGWTHYLALDLFVGTWILSNSQRVGITHLWVVPCLIFAFLLAPMGLVLYFIIRTIFTKKVSHDHF